MLPGRRSQSRPTVCERPRIETSKGGIAVSGHRLRRRYQRAASRWKGMNTSTSWPRAASALGRAPTTSPSPPVLANGTHSAARCVMRRRASVHENVGAERLRGRRDGNSRGTTRDAGDGAVRDRGRLRVGSRPGERRVLDDETGEVLDRRRHFLGLAHFQNQGDGSQLEGVDLAVQNLYVVCCTVVVV